MVVLFGEMSNLELAERFLEASWLGKGVAEAWAMTADILRPVLKHAYPDAPDDLVNQVLDAIGVQSDNVVTVLAPVMLMHFDRDQLIQLIKLCEDPVLKLLHSKLDGMYEDIRRAVRRSSGIVMTDCLDMLREGLGEP